MKFSRMTFNKMSHMGGPDGQEKPEEILFSTPFDYLFPDLARNEDALLPEEGKTIEALNALGDLMADAGKPTHVHEGTTYHFCSDGCRTKFAAMIWHLW